MALLRTAEYTQARIEKIASYQASKISKAFILAVNRVRSAATLEKLANLLEEGKFEEALDFLVDVGQTMGSSYGAALHDAATSAQTFLNTGKLIDTVISFKEVNARALEVFDAAKLDRIKEFGQTQVAATRQAIRRGITEGLNPRDMAREFRSSIGLTTKQESYVSNYRKALASLDKAALDRKLMTATDKKTLEAAIKNNKALTSTQIDTMVDRYRVKFIAYRAKVIGRTEALQAVHQGTEEMWKVAINNGTIGKHELVRTWVTGKDERVRASHATMNNQDRLMGETFLSGKGNALMYPGDPSAPLDETIQCRCVLTTRFVPGGVKALAAERLTWTKRVAQSFKRAA